MCICQHPLDQHVSKQVKICSSPLPLVIKSTLILRTEVKQMTDERPLSDTIHIQLYCLNCCSGWVKYSHGCSDTRETNKNNKFSCHLFASLNEYSPFGNYISNKETESITVNVLIFQDIKIPVFIHVPRLAQSSSENVKFFNHFPGEKFL